MSKVIAVCQSEEKGIPKDNIKQGFFEVSHGLKGDAHAGDWHRQVSLLAIESIDKMRETGLTLNPGDFAENLTTEGVVLQNLPVGTRLKVGSHVILEVTQIGKKCHKGCAIYQKTGDCIMPREGIFARVLNPGIIKEEDDIEIMDE